jgi:hypothetical protein
VRKKVISHRSPHATRRIPMNKRTKRHTNMYISEILQYLIWPGFIILNWFVIKFTLAAYEKKFPEKS